MIWFALSLMILLFLLLLTTKDLIKDMTMFLCTTLALGMIAIFCVTMGVLEVSEEIAEQDCKDLNKSGIEAYMADEKCYVRFSEGFFMATSGDSPDIKPEVWVAAKIALKEK